MIYNNLYFWVWTTNSNRTNWSQILWIVVTWPSLHWMNGCLDCG